MGEAFTIQISSNLVNRLIEDDEKSKKKVRKPKPNISRKSQSPQTKVPQKQISEDPETQKTSSPMGWPPQPPFFLPVPPPQSTNAELEAIQSVLRESEGVLEKLQKHEDDMSKQVAQRAKQLHEKEFRLPYRQPMPCLAEKDACLACYKEHVKDPLRCADAVEKFKECAHRVQQQARSDDK
ncbi:hypothetical protein Nepgr_007564 [Nepenthes gracilis]|uniref:Uncharacterized protein n=1 Tax=Nepenthes gracilis TaxID=150966 RepID=A0AAD3S7H5_NEPGR|nr:hypothetical protein Nepgr_007564 [Nepenthes gracilis]